MLSLILSVISLVFCAFPVSLERNMLLGLSLSALKIRLENYWLITLSVFGVATCLVTFSVGNIGICVVLSKVNAD